MAKDSGVACNMALSSVTGGLTMAITNPLDTLRLRWQVTPASSRGGSVVDFARDIVRKEGLGRGLWFPAIGTNSALCSITVGFRLGLYPFIRDPLVDVTGNKSPIVMFVAGLMSGACGYFLGCPLYLVKNRLQSEAGIRDASGVLLTGAKKGQRPSYSNGLEGLRVIMRSEGIRGLWQGAGVLVLRGATLSSSQLAGYDFAKSMCKAQGWLSEGQCLTVVASIAGALSLTACTMPLDVVLNRYQTGPTLGTRYTNPMACATQLVRTEGPLVFWRGAGPMFTRMLPSSLITFGLYESLRLIMGLGYLD